jgi:hypothetical protein
MENENKEKIKLIYRENNFITDDVIHFDKISKNYDIEVKMIITEHPDFLARHDKKSKENK